MTKALWKAIMRRSQLQVKYFKNKAQNNMIYLKFYSMLYKKRKKFYNALDIKPIINNKQFWKTIKSFSSEKRKTSSKILLKNQEFHFKQVELDNILI